MKPSDVNLLIVDDEPDVLESLSDLFDSFGFSVDSATSGNKAWEKLQRKNYNLVLTDVRMADGNGMELAQKIRHKHPSNPTLLLISGYTDSSLEDMFSLGVDGFFSKPFDSTAVRNAIQRSMLKPELRLTTPENTETPSTVIEKRGTSITSLESSKQVLFGRGGFYFSSASSRLKINSQIGFQIEITESPTVLFSGVGTIRWINSAEGASGAGIGIEINHMSSDHIKQYMDLFGSRVSFIPSPKSKA